MSLQTEEKPRMMEIVKANETFWTYLIAGQILGGMLSARWAGESTTEAQDQAMYQEAVGHATGLIDAIKRRKP